MTTTVKYPPPRVVRILSTLQILFRHPSSPNTIMCKVDIKKLNSKLDRLQNEGMRIIGVYHTDVDKDPQAIPTRSHYEEGGSDDAA